MYDLNKFGVVAFSAVFFRSCRIRAFLSFTFAIHMVNVHVFGCLCVCFTLELCAFNVFIFILTMDVVFAFYVFNFPVDFG